MQSHPSDVKFKANAASSSSGTRNDDVIPGPSKGSSSSQKRRAPLKRGKAMSSTETTTGKTSTSSGGGSGPSAFGALFRGIFKRDSKNVSDLEVMRTETSPQVKHTTPPNQQEKTVKKEQNDEEKEVPQDDTESTPDEDEDDDVDGEVQYVGSSTVHFIPGDDSHPPIIDIADDVEICEEDVEMLENSAAPPLEPDSNAAAAARGNLEDSTLHPLHHSRHLGGEKRKRESMREDGILLQREGSEPSKKRRHLEKSPASLLSSAKRWVINKYQHNPQMVEMSVIVAIFAACGIGYMCWRS